MGRTHALTGWCGGLVAAPLVGVSDAASALVFAVGATGAALLPDLDHLNARATRLLGPITWCVSKALRGLSRLAYNTTATSADSRRNDPHRTLTHTFLFSLALGGVVAAVTAMTGVVGVLITAGLLLLLAVDALGPWMLAAAAPGVIGILLDPDALEQLPAGLGVAVALGGVVHILGDWVTEAPVPMLWPVPIVGRRWFPCNAPRFVRFRVDGKTETHLLAPLFTVLGVLLIPGVGDAAATMVDAMTAV